MIATELQTRLACFAGWRSPRSPKSSTAARLRSQIKELKAATKAQVRAIEAGVDPELVQERITELKAERKRAQEALLAAGPEPADDHSELAAALEHLPDLSDQLEAAPLEVQRQVFNAFDLRVVYDRAEGRITLSATVSEQVAKAFASGAELVAVEVGAAEHGGGRIRTCEG